MGWIYEAGKELTRAAGDTARSEVDRWQREIERPWRQGRNSTAARTGRWIGLGLAVGAIVTGVGLALYLERPWE